MEADPQTVFDFALLFRGGKVAIDDPDDDRGFRPWQTDDGGFIPADGKDWISVVDDHLNTGPSIGVYPLFTQNDQHMVYWGCVDWDDPPQTRENTHDRIVVNLAFCQWHYIAWHTTHHYQRIQKRDVVHHQNCCASGRQMLQPIYTIDFGQPAEADLAQHPAQHVAHRFQLHVVVIAGVGSGCSAARVDD